MHYNQCKLAIDIGGTSVKAGLVRDGKVLKTFEVFLNSDGPACEILQGFKDIGTLCKSFADEQNLQISGVGVSVPGPFDYEHGASLMDHKYPSIKGISLTGYILDSIGEIPISYISDASAFLQGAVLQMKISNPNVCAVTIGTGLGFSCMIDGKLCHNEKGGPFVILFTKPYKDSIAEEYVSKRAIMRRYYKRTGEMISVADIDKRARTGDRNAIEVFHETGDDLARIMHPIIREYSFSAMIIGGQISKGKDLLTDPIKKRFNQLNNACEVLVPDNLSETALIGAVQ